MKGGWERLNEHSKQFHFHFCFFYSALKGDELSESNSKRNQIELIFTENIYNISRD